MPKEEYYLFADNGAKDEYGLPTLHLKTSVINFNGGWTSLASFLKSSRINLDEMAPVYKVPEVLRSSKDFRDLTAKEIEKWEAEVNETKSLVDKLK